jgi:hypothetical protein
MDGSAALDAFLSEQVTPFLHERGFGRSGQRYRAARGRNAILVRFQRRLTMFTADLGVSSATLIEEFGRTPPEHWTIRLGPPILGYDKWWDLEDGAPVLAEGFLPTLGRGLDMIEPLATDEGMRDALLRLAIEDRRGLSPIMAQWCVVLIRRVGPGDWVDAKAESEATDAGTEP